MRACRTRRATTSVVCCTTRPACWRSRTRRRTRTTVSSRASRLRSTSCTRAVTAPRASASRSPARTRRPSASSSACPDPSANPYLAFAACLLAGLDGIVNKIEPMAPVDKDLYELPPEEHAQIPTVPASLDAVLDELEKDHDYLLAGGVFTSDLIEDVDRDEACGHRRDPHASAPARVRDVLRHVRPRDLCPVADSPAAGALSCSTAA